MEGVRGAISQGPGRVIFIVIIAIVFIVLMYYLYQWLNGDADYKDYLLYNSVNVGLPANSTAATTYTSDNVPGIYPGGEFSVSTWIYVKNWSTTGNKPFLVVSGGTPEASGYKTLVLYLGQRKNKLGVRVSYDVESTTGSTTVSTTNLNTTQMNSLKNADGIYRDESTDSNNGDIDQIPLQKWVNITVVLAGRTLDVYIDGKLSRSTILPGMYKIDGSSSTVTLGGPNGFGGVIGKTRVANFAYSPDHVYSKYTSGPYDNSILGTLLSYINPSQYRINIQKV
jgi:hypothetical protein